MNVEDIKWRIAQLASLPYQEHYVINGTLDEYVVDTELLENVLGLKHVISKPENRALLTSKQVAALEDIFFYIEKHSEKALSGNSREETAMLIQYSEIWKNLRIKAAYALSLFGLEIEKMSLEDIDHLAND